MLESITCNYRCYRVAIFESILIFLFWGANQHSPLFWRGAVKPLKCCDNWEELVTVPRSGTGVIAPDPIRLPGGEILPNVDLSGNVNILESYNTVPLLEVQVTAA